MMGEHASVAKSSKVKLFNRKHPPKSVKLLGYDIAIKVVPYLEDNEIELLGAWCDENKTIYLLKGCNWRSVLLHELGHACLSLTGANQGLGTNVEERLILAWEAGIAPLL